MRPARLDSFGVDVEDDAADPPVVLDLLGEAPINGDELGYGGYGRAMVGKRERER